MTDERTGREAEAEEGPVIRARADGGRRTSLLSLACFDMGGPLAVYYGLRASGSSTVVALVVSGLLPAVGISLTARWHRRVDAVGVVVLLGIFFGTFVGLASGSARLVLIDGTVPTAVLGVACFGSFLTSRPLMFRVALQFMGPGSPQGRQFENMWQHPRFRNGFAVITAAWGTAFLCETAAQVVVIESTSINTAKTTSNLMPVAVAVLMMVWTTLYGRWQQVRAERVKITGEAEPNGSPNPAASLAPTR